MEDFPSRLKSLRERKGMTLYRLAQLTGISKQGVINLEVSGADPKLSTVEKVAAALGVSVAELLGAEPASTGMDQSAARPVTPSKAAEPLPDSSTAQQSGEWGVYGERLRVLRAEPDLSMTIDELAVLSGLEVERVRAIEGGAVPTYGELFCIADGLGSPDLFLSMAEMEAIDEAREKRKAAGKALRKALLAAARNARKGKK